MLSIAGSIGLGLVSGWAAARLMRHTRWFVVADPEGNLIAFEQPNEAEP